MIPNLKVEIIPPVYCKGLPKEADFKALDNLADTIAQKHKGVGRLCLTGISSGLMNQAPTCSAT